jgi:hypothetical protein
MEIASPRRTARFAAPTMAAELQQLRVMSTRATNAARAEERADERSARTSDVATIERRAPFHHVRFTVITSLHSGRRLVVEFADVLELAKEPSEPAPSSE